MAYRNGPTSYDCSSSVYFALIEQGKLPAGHRIGNTDSMFNDLERTGWSRVSGARQRGDIFIWGARGASGGAAGHTGVFENGSDIIHCAYGYNGIAVTNHDWLWQLNGSPSLTVYRFTGASYTPPAMNETDQSLDVGSTIRFNEIFTADEVALVGGIWQVRTHRLCPVDFTWDDNGIPAAPLIEVDSNGHRTPDQSLDNGSRYVLPGKYRVLDLGEYKGRWMALLEWNGLKFWVDVESATEIRSTDGGTPEPGNPPAPTPPPPQPVVPPVIPGPEPVPETPVTDTPTPEVPVPDPETPTKPIKEDKPVAFTPEQQQQLVVATEKAQAIADKVSADESVEELTKNIPLKVRIIVYIIGDTLIGIGLITPGLAIVLGWTDVSVIAALSGVFATAGGFLLTMFNILKKK